MSRTQRKYDHEYKVQAVKLAREIGGAKAAWTLYSWSYLRWVRDIESSSLFSLLYMNSLRIRCQLYLYNIKLKDTTLSSAWTAAMANGQQPSAPEDYIEVDK